MKATLKAIIVILVISLLTAALVVGVTQIITTAEEVKGLTGKVETLEKDMETIKAIERYRQIIEEAKG